MKAVYVLLPTSELSSTNGYPDVGYCDFGDYPKSKEIFRKFCGSHELYRITDSALFMSLVSLADLKWHIRKSPHLSSGEAEGMFKRVLKLCGDVDVIPADIANAAIELVNERGLVL
jgi:hypothetical protein